MTRALAVLLGLAACGGPMPTADQPRDAPRLHLIGCKRAPAAIAHREDTTDVPIQISARNRQTVVTAGDLLPLGPRVATYDPPVVERLVASRRAAIDACFARRGGSEPSSIHVDITTSGDGKIRLLRASGPESIAAVCAATVLFQARLPAVPGGTPALASMVVDVVAHAKVVDSDPWLPYARRAKNEVGPGPGVALEAALRNRLETVEHCFALAPTGSLRAIVELGGGKVLAVHAGGLGDAAAEHCAADAIAGLPLAAQGDGEIACDLSFGNAERWRVSPGDYHVVDAEAGPSGVISMGGSFLVVAAPDTNGVTLERTLSALEIGELTVLAMRDARAPIYVGVAAGGAATLEIANHGVRACGATQPVALADSVAVDRIAELVARRCRTGCAATIGFGAETTVRELVEVATAARRAGIERIAIGGACAREPNR